MCPRRLGRLSRSRFPEIPRESPTFPNNGQRLAKREGTRSAKGVTLPFHLTRQSLADMTGTTVETAIRILSRRHRDGVLDDDGGRLLLTDREGRPCGGKGAQAQGPRRGLEHGEPWRAWFHEQAGQGSRSVQLAVQPCASMHMRYNLPACRWEPMLTPTIIEFSLAPHDIRGSCTQTLLSRLKSATSEPGLL